MPFSGLFIEEKKESYTNRKIRELNAAGLRAKEIAKEVGLNIGVVYARYRRMGLIAPARTVPFCYDDLYEHAKKGGSIASFSEKTGLTKGVIYHYLGRDCGSYSIKKFMETYK